MISQTEIEMREILVNEEKCRVCKGKCCQRHACDCSPEDFDNDIRLMRGALETGKYAIDFTRSTADAFVYSSKGALTLDIEHILKTENEALYIRGRNRNRPIVDILHTEKKEGPCVMWSLEKGCELSFEQRPKYGRTVIPFLFIPENCINTYTKQDLIQEWKPYTKELFKLAKEFFPKDWELYEEFNIVL